jgi:hypothetical protein
LRSASHGLQRTRQRGLVGLVIVATLFVAGAAWLFVTLYNPQTAMAHQKAAVTDALAQAKQALIAHAATYDLTHPGQEFGYLPCPDTTYGSPKEGSENTCGSKDVSQLGKLPWGVLELDPHADGLVECLWYAAAGHYKNSPKTDVLNWDTAGQFEIVAADGTVLLAAQAADPNTQRHSYAVAVLFWAGSSSGAQDRAAANPGSNCGGNYVPANYLDSDASVTDPHTGAGVNNAVVASTANGISRFIAGPRAAVNDTVVYVTADEIYAAVLKRADKPLNKLTKAIATCIATAAGLSSNTLTWATQYPFPSPYDYASDANYVASSGSFFGHVPASIGQPCFASTIPARWDNWKDHLFLAVSKERTQPCSAECLTVNGTGQYAAIVLFAGMPLANKPRNTPTQKGDITRYLEGRNQTYQAPLYSLLDFQSGTPSSGFNDFLQCIKPDLTVSDC